VALTPSEIEKVLEMMGVRLWPQGHEEMEQGFPECSNARDCTQVAVGSSTDCDVTQGTGRPSPDQCTGAAASCKRAVGLLRVSPGYWWSGRVENSR
jgi:hypothetical protein